jgi:transposase
MSEVRTASPSSTVIIVGVDTHKFVHVAVAIDHLGTRLASCSVSVDRAGYAELLAWARALGRIEAFGIEGTGSYGVGLASYVRRQALRVVEVSHCDRRKRRNNGKSDTLDAESAARSVLAGLATAVPKSADGAAEMVRQN